MGEKQFRSTFRSKKDPNSSPAVLDLLGSVRPKIYALLHILNCSRGELVEEVNDRYKISWRTLSVTDEVSIWEFSYTYDLNKTKKLLWHIVQNTKYK